MQAVAPFTGAWIEIHWFEASKALNEVAPFTGAWIEIPTAAYALDIPASLPSRERGLKFRPHCDSALRSRRSLHGSVD